MYYETGQFYLLTNLALDCLQISKFCAVIKKKKIWIDKQEEGMELEVPTTTLSWEAGHAAIAAAVAHAQRLGVRINVAVCDASGLLVAFLRMPLSFSQSIELAIDKARTAAGFGISTSALMAE
ncbi:MAG: heme-binding protein, partial [Tepidiphilus sp.]|nr:heme-binding protein [Tepidiphilus sp.]